METTLSRGKHILTISDSAPTRIIGERINPTNRKKLTTSLVEGNFEVVQREAIAQVTDGANILDVNVGAPEIDEISILPRVVAAVMEVVSVPLSIDTTNPEALRAALEIYEGKALVNSVNGEEKSLSTILPIVADYGAAVIGLTMDDHGIPSDAAKRLQIASSILKRTSDHGISQEDVLIDCLAMAVSADTNSGLVTIESIRQVKQELGVNMTIGASNISFGLPDREILNRAAMPLFIQAGVNCPIANAAKVRDVVLATDVLLGRDEYAMNYIRAYRERQKL